MPEEPGFTYSELITAARELQRAGADVVTPLMALTHLDAPRPGARWKDVDDVFPAACDMFAHAGLVNDLPIVGAGGSVRAVFNESR